jgi:hypothetical protein
MLLWCEVIIIKIPLHVSASYAHLQEVLETALQQQSFMFIVLCMVGVGGGDEISSPPTPTKHKKYLT